MLSVSVRTQSVEAEFLHVSLFIYLLYCIVYKKNTKKFKKYKKTTKIQVSTIDLIVNSE